MEASEEKRSDYQEVIKDIPTQRLVYIDESGIELTICKDRGWVWFEVRLSKLTVTKTCFLESC